MGLPETRNIHRILIHPRDPNTVFVAATGSAWGDSPDRGVYKTTDGGQTWSHEGGRAHGMCRTRDGPIQP